MPQESVGALCLLFAINAVALVLLFNASSNQKNAANYAQRAEQAVAASSRLERLVVDGDDTPDPRDGD